MHPLTIITVTFNSAETLERTIRSVFDQVTTADQVEHLIIDGGSTDGTVDIIMKWEARGAVTRWVSEADEGIYDAMNKGLRLATGEYVCMLNSDDELAEGALVACLAAAATSPPFFFGDHLTVWPGGEEVPNKLPPARIILENLCCHQALWVRRDLLGDIGPYRTDLGLAADYDFMIRLYDRFAPGLYADRCLCVFHVGGTATSRIQAYHESALEVVKLHLGTLSEFGRSDATHGTTFLFGWSGRLLDFLKVGETTGVAAAWLETTGRGIGFRCSGSVLRKTFFLLAYASFRHLPSVLGRWVTRPLALLLHHSCRRWLKSHGDFSHKLASVPASIQ